MYTATNRPGAILKRAGYHARSLRRHMLTADQDIPRQIEQAARAHELQLAHTIQTGMTPQAMPRLAGFDFGARMEPAGAVGGDFFDFLPLDEDHLGILVGDVAGKGVPAALVMAVALSLFRAEACWHATPRQALARLNQYLVEHNDAGLFVTMLYGVLERRTGRFSYARAGHELPLVVASDGSVQCPAMGLGQPLGVFATPELDEQTIVVPQDGALLLFTDGATEMMDPAHRPFGLGRIETLLRAHRDLAPQALCDHLLRDIISHCGGACPSDDVTLVAVASRDEQRTRSVNR
jgi:sigma-B regulation protein RsbU (phosphoserine phosphatase)